MLRSNYETWTRTDGHHKPPIRGYFVPSKSAPMIPKPAKNLQFFKVIKLIFSCFELNTDPESNFHPVAGEFSWPSHRSVSHEMLYPDFQNSFKVPTGDSENNSGRWNLNKKLFSWHSSLKTASNHFLVSSMLKQKLRVFYKNSLSYAFSRLRFCILHWGLFKG